jgi:hypothetical protein
MGLRPTQGDEKRLPFSNYCPSKHGPPLCHLDRSAAERRDLCVDALSWECFSTERSTVEGSAVFAEFKRRRKLLWTGLRDHFLALRI